MKKLIERLKSWDENRGGDDARVHTIWAFMVLDVVFLPGAARGIDFVVNHPDVTYLETLVRMAPVHVACMALFVVLTNRLLRPVLDTVDCDDCTGGDLRAAAHRLHATASKLALAHTLLWVTMAVFGFASADQLGSVWGAALSVAMFAVCPWPVAYGISTWGVGPLSNALSHKLIIRNIDPKLPRARLSVSLAMLFATVCFGAAASTGSVALSAIQRGVSEGEFASFLALGTGMLFLYGVLLGLVAAGTITSPIARITRITQGIAESGNVEGVERVATGRTDELGDLADTMNLMLDQLVASEAERNNYRESLETLNRSLEEEVQRRTRELQTTNAVLEREIRERQKIETELRLAQKLEAVGQLAAGIAHEINTPLQYVGDNTQFLQQAFQLLVEADDPTVELDSRKKRKLEFVRNRVPQALESTLHGLKAVSDIVRAMKDFSHLGGDTLEPADLNAAIEATVMVSRNEWKYVAEVETDLAPELELVPCHLSEINQVLLNLVINAAHAVSDVHPEGEKGTITISSRRVEGFVELRVSDDGTGIPSEVRDRIFDPFFSTKGVGKGSGQGLSIAHRIIAEKHHGTLTFETETGVGTTFIVRLPLKDCPTLASKSAA